MIGSSTDSVRPRNPSLSKMMADQLQQCTGIRSLKEGQSYGCRLHCSRPDCWHAEMMMGNAVKVETAIVISDRWKYAAWSPEGVMCPHGLLARLLLIPSHDRMLSRCCRHAIKARKIRDCYIRSSQPFPRPKSVHTSVPLLQR